MNTLKKPHPVLFLVSAPSGAGKTTLCHRLLQKFPSLAYSVSSTTRSPREGEVNGVDYDFHTTDSFQALVERGEFLEHATVHGNLYGTRLEAVRGPFSNGQSVLLDIDVQGAELIRKRLEDDEALQDLRVQFVDVFIAPPSIEVLRERLVGRGKDSDEVIERRLQNAVDEMKDADRYQYHLINEDLELATEGLMSIYQASTLRNTAAY